MLQIREHGVVDYQSLKDMDHTDVGVLDETDRACLKEIGDYLASTDAWQRFAVWLLHKHFEPLPGEVFVERVITAEGRTETSPARRDGFTQDGLIASGLRFDSSAEDLRLIGLEFTEPSDFGNTDPLSAADEEVLASVADRLESHGKLERFGIKLIRNPLGLSEQQILLETCDMSTRTQHCEIGLRDELPDDLSIIETTWRWRVLEGSTTPVVMQECAAGCTPVGEGHDLAHHNTQYDGDSND